MPAIRDFLAILGRCMTWTFCASWGNRREMNAGVTWRDDLKQQDYWDGCHDKQQKGDGIHSPSNGAAFRGRMEAVGWKIDHQAIDEKPLRGGDERLWTCEQDFIKGARQPI